MTIFILKNLHWAWWILIGGYLLAMIHRSVKLWFTYNEGRNYPKPELSTSEWQQFDNLLGQVRNAYNAGNKEAAENRIDEIWNQYYASIVASKESISGYVNALILWGFAGTLFGSFMALFQMGNALTLPSVSARIAGTAGILRDALSLAMLTSLLSSIIGAVVITFLCSGFLNRWIHRIASILNDQIHEIQVSNNISNGQLNKNELLNELSSRQGKG